MGRGGRYQEHCLPYNPGWDPQPKIRPHFTPWSIWIQERRYGVLSIFNMKKKAWYLGVGRNSHYRLAMAVNSAWAVPAVLLMRVLSPLIQIRICKIYSERIGHFCSDVSEQIARQQSKNIRSLDLYYFGEVSNTQWEIMSKRTNLIVAPSIIRFIDRWNRLIPGGNAFTLQSSATESRDIEGLYHYRDSSIPFTEEENTIGYEYLKTKGWKIGEPFICLLVRDSGYLKSRYPNSDSSYHDYRNSEIQTYRTAMEWLVSQGVWVMRMGKFMNKPFDTGASKIIDYAFDAERSDLLDIWLFANCAAVISCGAGLDVISAIYRKPQLFLNAIPMIEMWTFSDSMWSFKHLKHETTGKDLTLSEYLSVEFRHTSSYSRAGIKILDQSETEILEVVNEFWDKFCGKEIQDSNNSKRQEILMAFLRSSSGYKRLHGWQHPNFRVSNRWLSSQSNDFFS